MGFAQERREPRDPGHANQPNHPLTLVGLKRLFHQPAMKHKHRVTRLPRNIERLPGAKPHRQGDRPLNRSLWCSQPPTARMTRRGYGPLARQPRRFPRTDPAPLAQRDRCARRTASM